MDGLDGARAYDPSSLTHWTGCLLSVSGSDQEAESTQRPGGGLYVHPELFATHTCPGIVGRSGLLRACAGPLGRKRPLELPAHLHHMEHC